MHEYTYVIFIHAHTSWRMFIHVCTYNTCICMIFSLQEEKCENSSGNELSGEDITVFMSNHVLIFLNICCLHNFRKLLVRLL